jgi:hypothetical protein
MCVLWRGRETGLLFRRASLILLSIIINYHMCIFLSTIKKRVEPLYSEAIFLKRCVRLTLLDTEHSIIEAEETFFLV